MDAGLVQFRAQKVASLRFTLSHTQQQQPQYSLRSLRRVSSVSPAHLIDEGQYMDRSRINWPRSDKGLARDRLCTHPQQQKICSQYCK